VAELSGDVLELLLCGFADAALWSEVVALGFDCCAYDGADELVDALLLGAAAADVVSVLLGAVGFVADWELTFEFVD
jgi:hypothetical protein